MRKEIKKGFFMLSVILFILAFVFSFLHILIQKSWKDKKVVEIWLKYLLFFNVGLMGIFAFYAHLFMADQTAQKIGWATGSPFQSEIGMANLSYGVLGILCLWFSRLFWMATIIGYSILLLGAFVIHMIQYSMGDVAPYNIGIFVWFNDLFLPLLLLSLLACLVSRKKIF